VAGLGVDDESSTTLFDFVSNLIPRRLISLERLSSIYLVMERNSARFCDEIRVEQ